MRRLADAAHADTLTYSPVGIAAMAEPPAGYRLDRWSRTLGADAATFSRSVDALRSWRVHTGAGLIVATSELPSVGLDVAMAAPLPVGFIDVVCRVVEVIDQPDCHGFTYGTLSNHPERGEESFTVRRTADGEVSFEIVAASRPSMALARLTSPVARFLQARATARYLDAMEAASQSGVV
jgi:uncharacterized protein (UPF0548 family)